jgi:catechol 2,3-dioxygenase-like lactoylglutathione lyase family enzyme
VRIDHVIWATADLDATAAWMEREHGLRAADGGAHDGMGTHNRIVPLGGGYLELLAVRDPAEAAGSDLGRAVTARLERTGEGLMGWAVVVDDIGAVARRLGTELVAISRQGFTARLTGVAEAMAEPCLPFFLERAQAIANPGAGADAGGITWLEVTGDAARLGDWLGGAELPLRVAPGPPALVAVGVGERELR